MTCAWIWKTVNDEANAAHLYDRDPYEFAQKHLWIPKFVTWSKSAYYAFTKDIAYG